MLNSNPLTLPKNTLSNTIKDEKYVKMIKTLKAIKTNYDFIKKHIDGKTFNENLIQEIIENKHDNISLMYVTYVMKLLSTEVQECHLEIIKRAIKNNENLQNKESFFVQIPDLPVTAANVEHPAANVEPFTDVVSWGHYVSNTHTPCCEDYCCCCDDGCCTIL